MLAIYFGIFTLIIIIITGNMFLYHCHFLHPRLNLMKDLKNKSL